MSYQHYEQLWEAAEQVAIYGIDESCDKMTEILSSLKLSKKLSEYQMGEILFHCCNLSRMQNINTFTALQKMLIDKKSEELDQKV